MNWYQMKTDEVISELMTSIQGLSRAEAQTRLEKYGPNELKEKKKKPPFMMFLEQFKDFVILVLLAAAVVSGFIGELSDTIIIIIIVILNAVIGFIQEYRAEKAMAALKKMAAPFALVFRNGMHENIPASRLVPGDVVLLEAGRSVPADLRLAEAVHLNIDESALTGESMPAEKHASTLYDEYLPIGDRMNMAYKGTYTTYGRGAGIVVATGMSTELGRIAAMLQEEDEVKTPLQKRLSVFGKRLATAILAICVIVFSIGVIRGEPVLLMLLTAISLAVAAMPEALPAVVTITLALGAKKLVRQNALMRKLQAVETLGSVTYICSDKTGTLTMNKMTVEEIWVNNKILTSNELRVMSQKTQEDKELATQHFSLVTLLKAFALCNDSQTDSNGRLIGDPTEIALLNIARDNDFEKGNLEKKYTRVAEIPFDSDRKLMTTFHKVSNEMDRNECEESVLGPHYSLLSFTKGAIDVLLNKSVNVLTSDGLKPLDAGEIRRMNEKMSSDGLRVLGIAMRNWDFLPDDLSPERVEAGLTIIGLAGMMDPPREEAKDAVALCMEAGIKPVMITGDHPLTARTIALRLGILEDDSKAIITGRELDELSLEEFEDRVEHIRVYARVAPEQKLKIVKALQDKGQFVAMTGDGINDAPALKRADIGIAMGVTGTDVSKEAAHMILLDDNFATVVKAVKEGRKTYDNIRKFIKYLLTTNSGEIWTLFLAPLVGLPIPLLPIHILWINLMTDGLPALALSAEPAEENVMKRPPRHPKESIFAYGLGYHAVWVGLLMAGVVLFVQAWFLRAGNAKWQTMVFTVLCLSQLGHVLAIRSEKESLFKLGLFSNKPLFGAVVLSIVLQAAIIYVPFMNLIFRTRALTLSELAVTLAVSSLIFIVVEIEKLVKRRRSVHFNSC